MKLVHCLAAALGIGASLFTVCNRVNAGDITADDKKQVIEQPQIEDWFHFSFQTGYENKYLFRGNDLTRGSDGDTFEDIRFSAFGVTLGLFAIQQVDDSSYNYLDKFTFKQNGRNQQGFARFRQEQTSFFEEDFFAQYTHSVGPIDITGGMVVFFIEDSTDSKQFDTYTAFLSAKQPVHTFNSTPEVIYRPFLSLSTSKIPYVTPSVTYYDTAHTNQENRPAGAEGYLENKISGSYPITGIISIDPYALISVSFRDRAKEVFTSEAVSNASQTGFVQGGSDKEEFYTGFHHVQAGVELPIRIGKYFTATPFISYVHLINLDFQDRQDNYYAGAKVKFAF